VLLPFTGRLALVGPRPAGVAATAGLRWRRRCMPSQPL